MADIQQLLQEIHNCPVATSIRNGQPGPCQTIVLSQTGTTFHSPEPWSGQITTAPILFLSSNPCKLPPNWRVYVWLFVPRDSCEILDAKLEALRSAYGSAFKVRITALEDVQPWRSMAGTEKSRSGKSWSPPRSRSSVVRHTERRLIKAA